MEESGCLTKKFVRVDNDDAMAYCVHFSKDYPVERLFFEVYPIVFWTDSVGDRGFSYRDKTSQDECLLDEFDEKKALIKFSGSYCWRGCWESRIYFTDDEYWGEEIYEINFVFKKIKEYCESLLITHKK